MIYVKNTRSIAKNILCLLFATFRRFQRSEMDHRNSINRVLLQLYKCHLVDFDTIGHLGLIQSPYHQLKTKLVIVIFTILVIYYAICSVTYFLLGHLPLYYCDVTMYFGGSIPLFSYALENLCGLYALSCVYLFNFVEKSKLEWINIIKIMHEYPRGNDAFNRFELKINF